MATPEGKPEKMDSSSGAEKKDGSVGGEQQGSTVGGERKHSLTVRRGVGSKGAVPRSSSKSGAVSSHSPKDVYETFLQFLKSPMWILPVMSFIEQRSLVFDSDASAANEKMFKEIHKEFKGMVDTLIECFCEDLGVQPKDIAQALAKSSGSTKTPIEQSMLEPVIAAQDYQVFVHMMMRKNIELQLQALQMIEIIYGLIPSVLLPGGPEDMGKNPEDQDRVIMIEVIRQSQEDYERMRKAQEIEDADFEKALKESLAEKDRLEVERKREQNLLDKYLQSPNQSTSSTDSKAKRSSSNTTVPAKSNEESKKEVKVVSEKQPPKMAEEKRASLPNNAPTHRPAMKSNKRTAVPTDNKSQTNVELNPVKVGTKGAGQPQITDGKPKPRSTNGADTDETHQKNVHDMQALLKDKEGDISPEELAKRRKYLLEQRDKLLQMKQVARQKAFTDAEDTSKLERPKTARAARSAIDGESGGNAKTGKDVLAARKALAEKLKSEIGTLA